MFDPRSDFWAVLVGGLLTRLQRLSPAAAPVDMALEALLGEPLFDLLAAIRAVGPYPAGSITGIEHVLQLLAVMHRGAADDVTPHQLVAPINADMVLVARSEEHTSELQSLMRISYAVFCLKKNKYTYQ